MTMMGNAPWENLRRRTIRGPVNPLDKSTVVSIYPKSIHEVKHTIQPGVFDIPAGSLKKPSILVVGPSSWWKELNPEEPLLEIPTSSIVIADSIIKDYANGLIECNMNDLMPGLFYVQGAKSAKQIIDEHQDELKRVAEKQRNWFFALIKAADILWARSNGNPLSVSDDMRMAAEQLDFKDKPWLKDFQTLELTHCPACGVLRNNQFPVCQTCHTIIDRAKYDALNFSPAAIVKN